MQSRRYVGLSLLPPDPGSDAYRLTNHAGLMRISLLSRRAGRFAVRRESRTDVDLSRKSCMFIWTMLVAVGVVLIFAIGYMLFYSPGRDTGVSASGSHAIHAPK